MDQQSRQPTRLLRGHRILGSMQIAAGGLLFLLNIGLFASTSSYSLSYPLIGSGFWAGSLFIAAGAAGVVVSRGGRSCGVPCALGCLVLSVIASCLGLSLLVFESIATNENYGSYQRWRCKPPAFMTYYALSIACVLLFTLEFVAGALHSGLAFCNTCGCLRRTSEGSKGGAGGTTADEQQQPSTAQRPNPSQPGQFSISGFPQPGQAAVLPGMDVIYLMTPDGQLIPAATTAAAVAGPNSLNVQPPPYVPREEYEGTEFYEEAKVGL